VALALGVANGMLKVSEQSFVILRKPCNELLAGGGVGCGGDPWRAGSKEFLLLELHPFPWWVPEHHVEAAGPPLPGAIQGNYIQHMKDVGERQVEVQEAVAVG